MTTFVTAAFCLVRDGRLLTVRKAGSVRFMLPGGKIDPGESARAAAVREVMEEVGLDDELPADLAPLLSNHVVPSLRAHLAS